MTNSKATGTDIIEALINNLNTHLEPIYYTAQAPSLYHVYLHDSDFRRLKGIFPQIITEAKQALAEEMKRLNRKGVVASLRETLEKHLAPAVKDRFSKKTAIDYQTPKEGWQIAFYTDVKGELNPGDVVILSELAVLQQMAFSGESLITTVRTIKRLKQPSASESTQGIPVVQRPAGKLVKPKSLESVVDVQLQQTLTPQQPAQAHSAQPTSVVLSEDIYAVIRYNSANGAGTFQMTKNSIAIGRGGKNHHVDLKLKTDVRVSREHVLLRRDKHTGRFYIKDLSRYGVTVNGKKLPNNSDGVKSNVASEVALPLRAHIVLADVVTLEFVAMEDEEGDETKEF